MKLFKLLILFLLLPITKSTAQVIHFTDLSLKQYLLQKLCVDTTNNGLSFSHDISVDLNGDSEIQVSEAIQVERLEIKDFANNYSIYSLQDLNAFPNLKSLTLISLDDVIELSNLQLDSLESLWISDGTSYKIIDLSNLPNLTKSLRIEGITTLDTLNISNGTVSTVFSLFYTFDIKYACIDSIPHEINEFSNAGAMLPGLNPSFNCNTLHISNNIEAVTPVKIYPNPIGNLLWIDSGGISIKNCRLLNSMGQTVAQITNQQLDTSQLAAGVYSLSYQLGIHTFVQKIIKL